MLPGSILNPGGVGNVNATEPLWHNLSIVQPDPENRRRGRVDDNGLIADPNTVMLPVSSTEVSQEIIDIVTMGRGAPNTAELVAAELAELYGPFTANNSPENRTAIINTLQWIAGTMRTRVRL